MGPNLQITAKDKSAIDILDLMFRDYEIITSDIVNNFVQQRVIIPIDAPDWPIVDGSIQFRGTGHKTTRWLMQIDNVTGFEILYSEQTTLTRFELGHVSFIPPDQIVIEAHYILTIRINCSRLSVSISKGKATGSNEGRPNG